MSKTTLLEGHASKDVLGTDQPEHIPRSHVTGRLHQAIAVRKGQNKPRIGTLESRTHKMTNSGTILVILAYDSPMINPAAIDKHTRRID